MTLRSRTLLLIGVVLLATSCAQVPLQVSAPKSAPVSKRITHAQSTLLDAQQHVSTAVSDIVNLEILTANFPEQHKLVLNVHNELDVLTKLLALTQRDLIDAQDKLVDFQFKVDDLTTKLNAANAKVAALKPKHSFDILGILSAVVSFTLNPMGFLIGKTINLLLGIAVSCALVGGAWFLFRWWMCRRALTRTK